MLQIRLRKPAAEGGGSKSLPLDAVTVACPDHLVLADLPVAKSLGSSSASAVTKIVGRRSRRQLADRVHFCAHCDFPIAVYGRLSPCEHVFCLDCARSDSFCFICEERIQKIQTIKMMEGIYICAAPHCLKSFLKKSDFETHILGTHGDLLHPGGEKEGIDIESGSTRKPVGSESTVQVPPRPLFPSYPIPQSHEAHRPQFRDSPTPRPVMLPKTIPSFPGQMYNHSSEQVIDSNAPPGFDRMGSQNRFGQQGIDSPGGIRQETNQHPEFPFQPPLQTPNFAVPLMMNPSMSTPQYGYPHFFPDGGQPVFRPDSAPEPGSEQGSLSGYPRSWNMGPGTGMFEQTPNSGQGSMDYGRSPRQMASNVSMPSPGNKGAEGGQSGTSMDPRDNGKGILAPLPPPPPFPLQMPQHNRGVQFYSDETNSDGQGFS